jgi:diaminopimelate epimerase
MLSATIDKHDASVTIDMGTPRFEWNEIPLSKPFDDANAIELPEARALHLGAASMVNVGNPHCIFFVDDIDAHDIARFGPGLEHDPLFPERANISLAQATGPNSLRLRTWERGAGLTKACGTAACAAAVAAARRGLTGRKVTVTLPGGDLVVDWREADGHVLMTGPFALDYQGTLPPELLQQGGVAAQ